MKLQGYFVSVGEITYNKKDGTQGKRVEGMFAIKGERDVIRVSTWRDKDWCIEHGIKTGASGELYAHLGENDRGYYEQAIWGFTPLEEKEEKPADEKRPQPMEKTPEMVAAAEARMEQAKAENKEAQTDLPF